MGTRAWQHLLTRMSDLNRRLSLVDPAYPHTAPNAGAGGETLAAAEQRLGRRLPAQYRELLSIADGWDRYYRSSSLLGSDEIGRGLRWADAVDAVTAAFTHSNGAFAAMLGVDDDPTNCLPVMWGENDWYAGIVLFIDDGRGCRSGEAFTLGEHPPRSADLYTCLYDEMLLHLDDVVRTERGPHSVAWGRDIRIDPPSTQDILDHLRRLTRRLGLVSWSRAVRPGATPAELDGLAEALGGGLHPAHRDLLCHSDGLELVQRAVVGVDVVPHLNVLSVDDILKGDRWAQALAAEQHLHDAWSDAAPMPYAAVPPELRASPYETVTATHLAPFGIGAGPVGIDPLDGQLHWLRDTNSLILQRRSSIREMLLDHCDQLHARLTGG